MLETNIRIVRPGKHLYVTVRRAVVTGSDLSPDLLEKACNSLRYKHGLAAVPALGNQASLYVATSKPIANIHLEEQEWELDVTDAGDNTFRLEYSKLSDERFVGLLIERTILATLARRKDLWTLDSPRIFYERQPFLKKSGISVYHRYEVSALPIDKQGIGIVIDVGTAFFTTNTLAYYFDPDADPEERKRREESFTRLTGRQDSQKGTLLYNTGLHYSKCYFESAPVGLTCGSTGKRRIKGESYESLLDYYQKVHPQMTVYPNTSAVMVSFQGIDRPQPVAADHVIVRVMNELVPDELNGIDKIKPQERNGLIAAFWEKLGPKPLGDVAPGLIPGFWKPDADQITYLLLPELVFGGGHILQPPTEVSSEAYRKHFRARTKHLSDYGCYSIPPALTRTLLIAYPDHVPEAAAKQLAEDLVHHLGQWTNVALTTKLIPYSTVGQAIDKIRAIDPGAVVVFVLNNEPAAYFEASFQLPGCRIKRITSGLLAEQYRQLLSGAWDRRLNSTSLDKGIKLWDSFIDMNSLALLYLMEAVPFRTKHLGNYEAHLAIDVGDHHNFIGLALQVTRDQEINPSFLVRLDAHRKTDIQHEIINPVILTEKIQMIFKDGIPGECDPIRSLLIIRDGTLYERELAGVLDAIGKLKDAGYLDKDAVIDMVDLHKDSLKSIRVWEVNEYGDIDNPTEGVVLKINQSTVLVTTTGAASLHQGTADPIVIKSNGHCGDLPEAAASIFLGTQMNWFSPGVSQRLPLVQKIVDDELQSRSAQEIRRLR